MTINAPIPRQIPQLKALWQQAFGDTAAFIDNFFATGFAPVRCRCLTLDGDVAAALYWFDAEKAKPCEPLPAAKSRRPGLTPQLGNAAPFVAGL